jgi:hypothetical protein
MPTPADPAGAPPSPAAQAAAAAAAATPAPAPPPAPEPEIDPLPEDQDTFDRAYVEKIRGEAAKHRTAKNEVLAHFEGYTEQERTRFLQLAQELHSSPETALDEFQAITNRLATQLGKEITPMNTPAPEPTPEPAPTGDAPLTAEDIERVVAERLAAEKQAAAEQDQVAATFAEAEALDPAYKDPAAKAHLFAVAQHNGTDLAGAHEIIAGQLQETIDAAVAAQLEGLRTGTAHPPRTPLGDPSAGSKPVDWAAEAASGNALKLAKQRADERFRAAGLGGA